MLKISVSVLIDFKFFIKLLHGCARVFLHGFWPLPPPVC